MVIMKKTVCGVMFAGVLALVSVPLLVPMTWPALVVIVGAASLIGVLCSTRLDCGAVSLLALGSLIFYRPTDALIGLWFAGILFLFYHARIYFQALFTHSEISLTDAVLFLVSTAYIFFLVCYWQFTLFCAGSSLAKNFFAAKVWYGVFQYFAPLFGYALLGEIVVLLLTKRAHSRLLDALYILLTLSFAGAIVLTFYSATRLWLLLFGGLALLAAGRASDQKTLRFLGYGVLLCTALLWLSKFVVLRVIRHRLPK